VLHADEEVMKKIASAKKHNKPVEAMRPACVALMQKNI